VTGGDTGDKPYVSLLTGRFDCGHYAQLACRKDGLYEVTGCAQCVTRCPNCGASTGRQCITQSGFGTRTHRERIKAAGFDYARVEGL
jgi:hypothetical protein